MGWIPSVNLSDCVVVIGLISGIRHPKVHWRVGNVRNAALGIGIWYVVLKGISALTKIL